MSAENSDEAIANLEKVMLSYMPSIENGVTYSKPKIAKLRKEFESEPEWVDFVTKELGFHHIGGPLYGHKSLPLVLKFRYGTNTVYISYCFLVASKQFKTWFNLSVLAGTVRTTSKESAVEKNRDMVSNLYRFSIGSVWRDLGIATKNSHGFFVADTKLKGNLFSKLALITKSESASLMGAATANWWVHNQDVFVKEDTAVELAQVNFTQCAEANSILQLYSELGLFTRSASKVHLKMDVQPLRRSTRDPDKFAKAITKEVALAHNIAKLVGDYSGTGNEIKFTHSHQPILDIVVAAGKQKLYSFSVDLLLIMTEDEEVLLKEGREILLKLLKEK